MRKILLPLVILLASICGSDLSMAANVSDDRKEFYISSSGEDQPDCSSGNKENPWRSLSYQYEKGCIKPGATVIFRPGIYDANSQVFGGRLNVHGAEGNPITIKAEKSAGALWPVKFTGAFIISDAEYVVIEGIDFERKKKHQDILSIGASHVVIKNCRIHGSKSDFNKFMPSRGDCLKIAGGMKYVEDIQILNNEIYNCSEDAIDITGRKKILIKDNLIYDSWIIQIKGGADQVMIEGNEIKDMHYGISGNGMDCSDANMYCGNPVLQTLPVADRYEAKNVTIRNNKISNIYSGRAIDFSGWKNSSIINNRITNDNQGNDYAISTRNNVGSVFFDPMARNYCERNPKDCSGRSNRGSASHWKIKSKSRNIFIGGNYIESNKSSMIKIDPNTVEAPESIQFNKNKFVVKGGNPEFLFDDQSYDNVISMPIQHGPRIRLRVK